MTTKEKFLKTLKDQAQVYLDAHESMKGLPDAVFEALQHNKDVVSMEGSKEAKDALNVATSYGGSTNMLRQLLTDAGEKGLSKSQMVEKFPQTPEVYSTVTNALTWLKQKGEVESYKPKNVTMKGFFWKLKNK